MSIVLVHIILLLAGDAFVIHENYYERNKVLTYRVLKCDVIKMTFVKLWDLSGYSERTMSKRPTCQK